MLATVVIAALWYVSCQHVNLLGPSCNIKANVSENGRIYHVPGQRYYGTTTVNLLMGERWLLRG